MMKTQGTAMRRISWACACWRVVRQVRKKEDMNDSLSYKVTYNLCSKNQFMVMPYPIVSLIFSVKLGVLFQ